MKRIVFILVLFVSACRTNNQQNTGQDTTQVCVPGFRPSLTFQTESAAPSLPPSNDKRTIKLLLSKFDSPDFPDAKSVADSALHIASVLLSSADFKDTIMGFTFMCRNYSQYCQTSCKSCDDRFKGKVVLDSVFRDLEVKLDLFLRDCGNEYGHSTRNIHEIYSCQPVVFYDEKNLSPAYCYAYHIAHEYMHIVGFFHTDHKDDVAERTGWIGWKILLKWKGLGINVMQLQPGDR